MADLGDFAALIAIITGLVLVIAFGGRCAPRGMLEMLATILLGAALFPAILLVTIWYALRSLVLWPARALRRRRVRRHRTTWTTATRDPEAALLANPLPAGTAKLLALPRPSLRRGGGGGGGRERRKVPHPTLGQRLRIKPLPELPGVPDACVVCAEEKGRGAYAPITITEGCRHETHVCSECVAEWISAQLPRGNEAPRIRCPQDDCPQVLGRADVRFFASREVYHRYKIISARHQQISQPDFHWCMSPYGCPSGQIHSASSSGPKMQCRQCGFFTCVRHMVPWHAGETCEQYSKRNPDPDLRLRDERLHLAGLQKLGFMDCPMCSVTVHRTEGCDHISCKCGHSFCYLCGASYGGEQGIRMIGNLAHARNCPHYRP